MAEPCPLLLQLPQVRSSPAAKARPSGCEPVNMSCRLGVSPRPLTTSPFSLSAVCLVSLLLALWRSSTLWAITSPLAFFHGPAPMRSRALTAAAPSTACVLRYACQVWLPAPAPCASDWQCASAPWRPPRSAPLPEPALVTKNVILFCCACAAPPMPSDSSAADTPMQRFIALFMVSRPSVDGSRASRTARLTLDHKPWACAGIPGQLPHPHVRPPARSVRALAAA